MTLSTEETPDRAQGSAPTGIVAIWNPASGSAPDEGDLRDALGPEIDLVATTEDDPGPGQARQAVSSGARTIAICGGDGTIRACLDPVAGTDAAIDLVPLGTGNLLAANLDIPAGLAAAEAVGNAPRRTIDLGRVNGEAFAVMAGSGFDALMMRDAEDENKSRLGVAAYMKAGLRHLRRSLERTTVIVDGKTWFKGRTAMVLVGNFGTVSGGLDIFADADPGDGRLDVAVLSATSLRDWAGVAVRLALGRPESSDLVKVTQGEEIMVITDQARPYELDGEPRPATDMLRFSVDPKALRVHDRRNGRD